MCVEAAQMCICATEEEKKANQRMRMMISRHLFSQLNQGEFFFIVLIIIIIKAEEEKKTNAVDALLFSSFFRP